MNILKLSNLYNDSCNALIKTAQDLFHSKIYFWLQKTISDLMDELNFINKEKSIKLSRLHKIINFEKNEIIIPIEFSLMFGGYEQFSFKAPDKTDQRFEGDIIVSTNYRQIIQDDILDIDKNRFLSNNKNGIFNLAAEIARYFYMKMEYKNPKVKKRFDDYYKTIEEKRKSKFEEKNLFKNNPELFQKFIKNLANQYGVDYTEDDYNENSLKDKINKFYNSETAKMFSEKERQERVNKLIEEDDIYHKAMIKTIIESEKPDPFELQDLEINKVPKYEKRMPLNSDFIKSINRILEANLIKFPSLIKEINRVKSLPGLKYYLWVSKDNIENFLIKHIINIVIFDNQKKYFKTIIPRAVREFIKAHQDAFDLLDRTLKQRIKELEKYANEPTSLEDYEF